MTLVTLGISWLDSKSLNWFVFLPGLVMALSSIIILLVILLPSIFVRESKKKKEQLEEQKKTRASIELIQKDIKYYLDMIYVDPHFLVLNLADHFGERFEVLSKGQINNFYKKVADIKIELQIEKNMCEEIKETLFTIPPLGSTLLSQLTTNLMILEKELSRVENFCKEKLEARKMPITTLEFSRENAENEIDRFSQFLDIQSLFERLSDLPDAVNISCESKNEYLFTEILNRISQTENALSQYIDEVRRFESDEEIFWQEIYSAFDGLHKKTAE